MLNVLEKIPFQKEISIMLTTPTISDIFISALAIYVVFAAILTRFDSEGDKSNGWSLLTIVWILIYLGELWL